MKCKYVRKLAVAGVLMIGCIVMLSGCGDRHGDDQTGVDVGDTVEQAVTKTQELMVTFGDAGTGFGMHLYDNDTAAAIAGYVGTADWRLPIDHYDDYEGYEYYQYYDIPNRYDIPSQPMTVTNAKSGEVYYSEPNRMILFYQDAEVSQELTPVGYIDNTEEFVKAVEENPVLEGWGNKIVLISAGE